MTLYTGDSPKRSLEDISSIIVHAKLEQKDFLPTTEVLYIDGLNAKNDHYKLLELDNYLLESLNNNETIVFKGTDEDVVVLCTESHTYDVRECETSNSLLLIPDLEFTSNLITVDEINIRNKYVAGINYKYFEVVPFKPQLDKLLRLLEGTKYKGPEKEYEYDESKLFNFNKLLNIIQASRNELKSMLNKIDAIIINGKVRILDLDYHFRVISFLLKSIDENSWSLDEIDKNESIETWSQIVPKEILETLFNMYTEESKIINEKMVYKYNEFKVCSFFARVLLEYAGKFNLNDFLQAWKDSVPEGMKTREDMLDGIAIIDRNSKPNVIWAFSESNLPDTISERFDVLFKTKQKWTVQEITPYIQSLTTDKMDANALLAKYARASNVDGVRFYSAKHCN